MNTRPCILLYGFCQVDSLRRCLEQIPWVSEKFTLQETDAVCVRVISSVSPYRQPFCAWENDRPCPKLPGDRIEPENDSGVCLGRHSATCDPAAAGIPLPWRHGLNPAGLLLPPFAQKKN